MLLIKHEICIICSFKDFSLQPPAQELVARDLHDHVWTFRHIFRGMFIYTFPTQVFHQKPLKSIIFEFQGSQNDTCSQRVGACLLVERGYLQEIQSCLSGNATYYNKLCVFEVVFVHYLV